MCVLNCGQWANGERTGSGTCVLADSSKYEGNWASDKKSGYGVFVAASGPCPPHLSSFFWIGFVTLSHQAIGMKANGRLVGCTFPKGTGVECRACLSPS